MRFFLVSWTVEVQGSRDQYIDRIVEAQNQDEARVNSLIELGCLPKGTTVQSLIDDGSGCDYVNHKGVTYADYLLGYASNAKELHPISVKINGEVIKLVVSEDAEYTSPTHAIQFVGDKDPYLVTIEMDTNGSKNELVQLIWSDTEQGAAKMALAYVTEKNELLPKRPEVVFKNGVLSTKDNASSYTIIQTTIMKTITINLEGQSLIAIIPSNYKELDQPIYARLL